MTTVTDLKTTKTSYYPKTIYNDYLRKISTNNYPLTKKKMVIH